VNAPVSPIRFHDTSRRHPVAEALRRQVDGDVLFDAASRGRYATDASIYQIDPVGVVVPKNEEAVRAALQIATEHRVPILPRGAGTSQCGQTVGAALVIDCSRHLNEITALDLARCEVTVQPGVVLDQLNAYLRPHGLWFPVDVSTSAQATLGGMAGNNSCGARSLRYGNMVHNVAGIDAWLAGGDSIRLGPLAGLGAAAPATRALIERVHAIVRREAAEIAARWPTVLRRVQGYNLDMVLPDRDHNLAHLLVGSEGTLAFTRRLTLKLAPLPVHKALGVVHFPTFYRAMECAQHIVALGPDAVELVDRTMIGLARDIEAFRPTVEQFIRGDPDAILLVEFSGDDAGGPAARLRQLAERMGDLGLPDSVVPIADARLQKAVWEVRKAGLNIMMSMKGDGKPVSFIEDCAVPLEHLAEYTDRLTAVFEKHGTRGTWYAHASVGTLHVRPILDMRRDGAQKMRAIAEEACAMVQQYKGAFSGEHGDGLVRSEWIEPIIGSRLTAALAEIKREFDPLGLMNPGKIVDPPRMDDASLFRFAPGYQVAPIATALDWSDWGGLGAAVEMCNNNGHCRKFDAGTMCPSYRATRDEQHLTRGRANTLRLALSGQLGAAALASDEVRDAMDLCVGCKGCKRECPTGVDMARMKIEYLHQRALRRGVPLRERLVAWLPRYAPRASTLAPLLNLRDRVPGIAWLSEAFLGFSRRRKLPRWAKSPFRALPPHTGREDRGDVVLLADTFNRWFEPENLHAAVAVLRAAGYRVRLAAAPDGERPLCCGRTFLAAGLVDEAKQEAQRVISALRPHLERGLPIIGLEPSCLLTLRDEYLAMGLGDEARRLAAQALLFEEFIAREARAGRLQLDLAPMSSRILLHGHCHQKAFDVMGDIRETLSLIPGVAVELVETSCCGMAGSFGYEKEHYDVSIRMAEAALLPRLRAAGPEALVVADGTSCRHQIRDGSGRQSLHVARLLRRALKEPRP
jgi:FAD/FMN-containing dehydrogenase/Fe-S oxidoreductase